MKNIFRKIKKDKLTELTSLQLLKHFSHKFVKGNQSPPPPTHTHTFQNHPPITRIPLPFRKIPYLPTLPVNWSSQVFLITRNATVKLSSINTTHVKPQHTVVFFIFKFTLKYMLGNVYINKIHARQCLYISLYCREGFSHPFNFFVVSKGILHI